MRTGYAQTHAHGRGTLMPEANVMGKLGLIGYDSLSVHTAGTRRRDKIGKSLTYEIDIQECFKHKSTSVVPEYLSTDANGQRPAFDSRKSRPRFYQYYCCQLFRRRFASFTDSLQRILPERVTLVLGPVTFSSLNYLWWS